MTDALGLLGMALLGVTLASILLVPVWLHDRQVGERRVNELLRLLESRAAPAEVAAYLNPPAPEPEGEWIATEDGLIVTLVDDA